jgi:tetratricopeptide (TPR) repeat protein/KaiC/GvpD/RAD55 family RecA-like ATPase
LASAERDRISSPRIAAAREISLVDRVEEMRLLREAVDRTAQGEGGLTFLYGEAGIGKTRLARELRAYAHLRGMQVIYGRCPALFRMDGVPPYSLWSEIIREYLETCTSEQLYKAMYGSYPAEVVKLVPELRQKLAMIPQSFPIKPEQEQNRLFEAISQLITNISKETPLLVILDDLQWADPSSLLLLLYLALGVRRAPLLLLCAYRNTDVDSNHPLDPVLMELNRERLPQSVSLRRMSLNDVSEMVNHVLEQDDVSREFCELVYEKTRGNPFFVEEVIKSLKEEAVIYREEGKWKIKEVSEIEFPKTVRSVISKRVSRLDDECQSVLTLASFIGTEFSFEALRGVTGIEENNLLDIMERLLKAELVKEKVVRGQDLYCFGDIIVRDVIHEEVSHLRHKKLHGDVGRALEKVYAGKICEHLGELAYHFLESGDKDKALDYFLRASEKAQEVYAYHEAFSYLQHALDLLEQKEASPEQKVQIIEKLGDLDLWMGESEAAAKNWDNALVLWNQLKDKKNMARLHTKIASMLWQGMGVGDKVKASEHHRMALEILEREPESAELAGLYEDISHMLWRTGKSEESLTWAHKTLELAERLGASDVVAACYNDLGVLALKSGEFDEASEYLGQGLKIALENKLVGLSLTIYNNLCNLYYSMGEPQKIFETAQEGSDMARKVGSLYYLAWLDMMLMGSYTYMGNLQKAVSIGEDVLAMVKRIKFRGFTSYILQSLAICYRWLGEWDKSFKYSIEAFDLGKGAGEYQQIGNAALELGRLYMEMKDYDEAEKYLNEGNSVYEKAGDMDSQTDSVLALSRLYLEKNEIDKVVALIEKVYEYAIKARNRVAIVDAELLKAMLFRQQKNWEQSVQHFEKSLQEAKDLNAQKWHVFEYAEILYEYGVMYLKRNEEGDKEKAYSLLNQALAIYQKADSKKRTDRVESILLHIEGNQPIVEPKLIGNVATGWADLDKLLLGGMPTEYAVMLTSPSCDERDSLIKSFLEVGAKQGEVTFYVTMNPSASKTLVEKFPSSFYLFVCNPQADAIIKSAPNVFKLKGVENLTDISIALTSAIRKLDPMLKGPRRICMGLVSDVLLQHHAVQTRRWLTGLISELRSNGFTTLAVMDPEMHPSQEVRAVLDLFEGQIDIYEKETEKGLQKFLKIKKMSNQEYLENELLIKKEDLQKRK